MNEENKKVTRRKFLEDSSKKALVGTAAAFLGLGMIKPKPVHAASGCWPSTCTLSCEGSCSGSCSGDCTGSCSGLCMSACTSECSFAFTNGCTDACHYECTGDCASCWGGCTATGRNDMAAQAGCGTPVLEREVSTRQVTV